MFRSKLLFIAEELGCFWTVFKLQFRDIKLNSDGPSNLFPICLWYCQHQRLWHETNISCRKMCSLKYIWSSQSKSNHIFDLSGPVWLILTMIDFWNNIYLASDTSVIYVWYIWYICDTFVIYVIFVIHIWLDNIMLRLAKRASEAAVDWRDYNWAN